MDCGPRRAKENFYTSVYSRRVRFISVETLDLGGLHRAFACPKTLVGTVFEPENASHQTSEVLPNSFETHPSEIELTQATLYGLIDRARDLGLTLLSVKRIEPEEEEQ